MNLGLGLYGLICLWVAAGLMCALWLRRRHAGAFDIEAEVPPKWGKAERSLAVLAGLAAIAGVLLSLISTF